MVKHVSWLQYLQLKHQQEKATEVQKAKDQVAKEKDLEIRQILRHGEEHMKQLKIQLIHEKEEAVNVSTYEQCVNFTKSTFPIKLDLAVRDFL